MFKKRYWKTGELIAIGTFAALIKISTMMIAIAGGGMNPVTMVIKNIVATALLIVLLYKVRKFGVLSMYVLVSSIVAMLLMGGNMITIPGLLIAGIICDCLISLTGGYKKPWSLIMGAGLFDFLSRAISLSYSYFAFIEEPGLFIIGTIVVTIGYVGCLIGLGSGLFFIKELRHAGIIRE